jgi:hypothetical protein
MYVCEAGAELKAHSGAPLQQGCWLYTHIQVDYGWKAKDKHTSLLWTLIINGSKKLSTHREGPECSSGDSLLANSYICG